MGNHISDILGDKENTISPTSLKEIYGTARISQLWSKRVGSGTNELYIKLVPAILGEHVFIADAHGDITALDIASGKKVWKAATKLPITGGLGADFSMILLGTSEGDVISINPDTGKELWRAKVSSEVLSPPRESENVVVVRTIDGKLFALDADDGKRLWVYDRTVPALTLRGTSKPVISGDSIIDGFDGGRVIALDRGSGKLIWEARVAIAHGRNELERMVDIDAQPLVYQDTIYIAAFQSSIAAMLLQTGSILWQREISSYTEMSVDEENLYVSDAEGNVWALDRTTGASVWKQENLLRRNLTGPTLIGNNVAVGDMDGYLHWLDKRTGEIIARNRVSKSPILAKPEIVNDLLLVYASDGILAAYAPEDLNPEMLSTRPIKQQVGGKTTEDTPVAGKTEDRSFFVRFLDMLSDDEVESEYE